jgi:hypothetical protein
MYLRNYHYPGEYRNDTVTVIDYCSDASYRPRTVRGPTSSYNPKLPQRLYKYSNNIL